jgi:hypothetical protein
MRRFILITALVLASATAQAGSSRGLVLASNDEPTSERIEAVRPPESSPEAAKPQASAPEAAKPEASKPETSRSETSKPETSKPRVAKSEGSRPKAHGRRYDSYASEEARARSIAARYGVSW